MTVATAKCFNSLKHNLYNLPATLPSTSHHSENYDSFPFSIPKLSLFERREKIEIVANKLLRGAKATVAMKVFQFFLSKADNATGISRHSIETISQYIGYGKQWTQEGINLCVKVGLITRIRRGVKQTNIYMINYELIGDHSYKAHECTKDILTTGSLPCSENNGRIIKHSFKESISGELSSCLVTKDKLTEQGKVVEKDPYRQPVCFESVSVACQSSLYKYNNSITSSRNASFKKCDLNKDVSLANSTVNKPVVTQYLAENTFIESQTSSNDYQFSRSATIKRKWRPDPINRKEELKFFKGFELSKKSNHILENSVFNKYWVTSEYRQAYKCYIENNKPPFEEYGEFWNHKNANRYFPLWLKGTIKRKKEIELQGKTFFHYHNRQAYRKAMPYLEAKESERKINTGSEMPYNAAKMYVKKEQIKDEDMRCEVIKRINQEPDVMRKKVLQVCAGVLPAALLLLVEKNIRITKLSEDNDEICFHIFMKHIYSFERVLEGSLERELSTKEKRAFVRVIS